MTTTSNRLFSAPENKQNTPKVDLGELASVYPFSMRRTCEGPLLTSQPGFPLTLYKQLGGVVRCSCTRAPLRRRQVEAEIHPKLTHT